MLQAILGNASADASDSKLDGYRASRDVMCLHNHSPKPLSTIRLIKLGLRQ